MPSKDQMKSSKSKHKDSKNNLQASEDSKAIAWPLIDNGTRYYSDLMLEHLVPGHIVLIPNLWSAALCRKFVTFCRSLPLVTTPGRPKRGEAVRVNDRFQIDDSVFAETLWNAGLKQLVLDPDQAAGGLEESAQEQNQDPLQQLWGGEVLGLSSNIRIYRYSKGQYFDKHYDDSTSLLFPTTTTTSGTRPTHPTPAHTTWTLLLYLTSSRTGCVGGSTVFHPTSTSTSTSKSSSAEPIAVELQTGMALLHRHGAQCLLHEGRVVDEGEKWVLRSDLCVRG